MKNVSNSALLFVLSKHIQTWQLKVNRDKVGYYEAKGYSNRKNFKRNQRKGL